MMTTNGCQEWVKMPRPYSQHEMTEELKAKAKRELNEDEDTRKRCIDELRNLLRGEKDLYFQDEDDFLLQFLRARKFNVMRAFQLCKNYYNCRKDDLWGKIQFSTVMDVMEYNFFGLLPYRDKDGCVIPYFHSDRWEPDQVAARPGAQALMAFIMNSITAPATQISGYKLIVNCTGLTFKKAFYCTRYLWLLLDSVLNCFPARYKEIHVINDGPAFKYLWEVTKFLLSQKLRNKVHFHGKNLNDLHQYISPSILPEECGGDLGPFENSLSMNEMMKFEKKFRAMQKYGYDANWKDI